MDGQYSADIHLLRRNGTLLIGFFELQVDAIGQFFHRCAFAHDELILLGQFPALLVPHTHVDRVIFELKLVFFELNRDLSLFDELLLFHRLLSVYFAHFVIDLFPYPHLLRLKLNIFQLLQHISKHQLNLASLEISVNRHITDKLEFMKPIVLLRRGILREKQLYPDFPLLCRYTFLEE